MWPYPRLVAHRGCGTLAPENTIAALRCVLEHGFRAAEFDVMLSGDGIPVVLHDPELGRTVKGKGRTSDYSARQLTAMDAGSWFGKEFSGERVPDYEQFFRFCAEHAIWMNVEIKPVPGFEEQTGRVVAQCTKHFLDELRGPGIWHGDVAALPLFSSFSVEALMAAKLAVPEIPRALLLRAIPENWQEMLRQLDAVAIDVSYRQLRPEQVQAVKLAGYGLFCYTVNDIALAKKLKTWGVDAIYTDRIDLFGPDFWELA
ncbi:glycerophosphodiester phosphodiesterase [Oxalobacteraceae bacterium R-40]|uniref:Glycerophosphodiester phosphodiesterase n=1 Tax=Keguizhuia sedimenti TaxID=3064264 RepID=A0ABU1BRM2_9BURK|nr:glycerophosphodiester phosphodiesterase [Oxalobacteraceae bacterium R-40]